MGLTSWPLPLAALGLLLCAGMQALVLKAQFFIPTEAGEEHEHFVNQVQRQVENARHAAIYDSAVGLYQRWYLETRLKQECARCKRYGLSLAIIVVRFGDPREQMAITDWQAQAVQAAYVLGKSVRNVDLAAIIGPKEFAVSLVHCDREGAEVAMQRLAQGLQEHATQLGLAVYPEDDLEPSALIELAQSRLATPPAIALEAAA